MEERSYEDAADEFEGLDFYQSISRFAGCFDNLSRGELAALRSRFVQLAYLEDDPDDDERKAAHQIAAALEEVILFNLKSSPVALENYLTARNKEYEFMRNYGVGTIAHDVLAAGDRQQEPGSPEPARGLFKWLSRK
ncbi:hypothetical protein R6U79_12540 [Pseudomonas putida]|uniref:hypothetical protein n=1 Tax=Pseudomonas putida TaxID=303 RepID=UPI0029DE8E5F|nr:hypothetical protein [Pseudomonas putida]WPK03032.1 hypothetical protein R6U79_12540 [Pseudomonas putida]